MAYQFAGIASWAPGQLFRLYSKIPDFFDCTRLRRWNRWFITWVVSFALETLSNYRRFVTKVYDIRYSNYIDNEVRIWWAKRRLKIFRWKKSGSLDRWQARKLFRTHPPSFLGKIYMEEPPPSFNNWLEGYFGSCGVCSTSFIHIK